MAGILLTIIAFLVIFSILVLVHEWGHFYAAKKSGIKVEEFGFGLPPRLWGKKKGETIFSINWIPFGGFVRMLGEDATDEKYLKNERSFIAQSMRKRVFVITAGVIMNFILAWFLLTIGFSFGMEPILTPEEVLPAINRGQISLEEGAKIKEVREDSLAADLGFRDEDVLVSFEDNRVDFDLISAISADPEGTYKVRRGEEILTYELVGNQLTDYDPASGLGLEFYDLTLIPRVKIFSVDENGDSFKYGLRSGDIILGINGTEVFFVQDQTDLDNLQGFESLVRGEDTVEYEIYRNGRILPILVELEQSRRVVLSKVLLGSPAAEADLREGDVIVSVNGNLVEDSEELINFVEANAESEIAYRVERDGNQFNVEIQPEDGRIGVLLSELISYGSNNDLSVYSTDMLSSVTEIESEQYSILEAPFKAFSESVRLAGLTVKLFGDVVGSLFVDGEVPDTVAGPVGIAMLTYDFVQEGFISLLRFMALLSLSLAVLNILPFPALDGGRLLFIVIEFVIGKRVNQKWEAAVHMVGYLLLIGLIIAVTYNDILRLFS